MSPCAVYLLICFSNVINNFKQKQLILKIYKQLVLQVINMKKYRKVSIDIRQNSSQPDNIGLTYKKLRTSTYS